MKQQPPTLCDALYQSTFSRVPELDMPQFRQHLRDARRFVLDQSMSAFMADLAHDYRHDRRHAIKFIDTIRPLARLPHATTWIEFDFRARAARTNELLGEKVLNIEDCPTKIGWLCLQDPAIETAVLVVECVSHVYAKDDPIFQRLIPEPTSLAMAWCYTTDDAPPPYKDLMIAEEKNLHPSGALCGINNYRNPHVGVLASPFLMDIQVLVRNQYVPLTIEALSSQARYLWSLLATINDAPTTITHTQATTGFLAAGAYRRFLDHSHITLNLPQNTTTPRLARRLLHAAKKRAHQVRGHWRKDIRPAHLGERIWVREHQRGDASLGFVTHDYQVTHNNNTEKEPTHDQD